MNSSSGAAPARRGCRCEGPRAHGGRCVTCGRIGSDPRRAVVGPTHHGPGRDGAGVLRGPVEVGRWHVRVEAPVLSSSGRLSAASSRSVALARNASAGSMSSTSGNERYYALSKLRTRPPRPTTPSLHSAPAWSAVSATSPPPVLLGSRYPYCEHSKRALPRKLVAASPPLPRARARRCSSTTCWRCSTCCEPTASGSRGTREFREAAVRAASRSTFPPWNSLPSTRSRN